MFDGLSGEKRWNVTFFDYASQPARESDYGNFHLLLQSSYSFSISKELHRGNIEYNMTFYNFFW